jgi:hypothetical protein
VEVFAEKGSWPTWPAHGTTNVPGAFSHLDQPDFRYTIETESAIYRRHYRTPEGVSRLGWIRNMYYNMLQQLANQDPVWLPCK